MPKTKPAHILIKFPTRSRPKKFFAGLDNILATANDLKNITIVITADYNDTTMYNAETLTQYKTYLGTHKNLTLIFGESQNKVHAINRDMEKFTDWDIVVVFSDDMEFVVKGWDDTVRYQFKELYANFDGNLHFNDGYVDDRCCTMLIMGKRYHDRFGYLYNPEYDSLECDVEHTIVAKKLKRIAYFKTPIAHHNHPVNTGKTQDIDAQLKFTEAQGAKDRITYTRRAKINYGLTDAYLLKETLQ